MTTPLRRKAKSKVSERGRLTRLLAQMGVPFSSSKEGDVWVPNTTGGVVFTFSPEGQFDRLFCGKGEVRDRTNRGHAHQREE